MNESQFTSADDVRNFALAGHAILTLRSAASGTRFTYKISVCKDKLNLWFVGLLTGSDNTSDYSYLGTIRAGQATLDGQPVYAHGRKSKIGDDAPSAKAFAWAWRHVTEKRTLPAALEVWHEGRCGRCGRLLTVPESVARGIGPDCAAMMCEAA
jgi:Family of unknown function (DUF6011)